MRQGRFFIGWLLKKETSGHASNDYSGTDCCAETNASTSPPAQHAFPVGAAKDGNRIFKESATFGMHCCNSRNQIFPHLTVTCGLADLPPVS
jgi:hypothetical protein